MKPASLAQVVRLSLWRDRRGALASVFGVVVGVAALVFFVALGLGVGRVVREKVFPLDASLVEVVPAQLSLGLLGGGKLDEGAVARLSALPGVAHAYRKMTVRVPAASVYDGDFFGQRLRMGVEVIAVGVDSGYLARDVKEGEFVDRGEGQPVPAVAATRLLEIYNHGFATSRGLPQLSPVLVTGFTFPVEFGRSFVTAGGHGPVTSTRAQVVGVSDRGLLAGLSIPLEVARRLNARGGVDATTYSGVALETADPAEVPRVVEQVKLMGLRVDDGDRRMAENAGAAVAITTAALALLSVLICVLAAFNIAHALAASVRARERDLAIFRAVGASRGDVAATVLAEALVLGASGGLVGVGVAALLAVAGDALAARALPEFPFKPDSFFLLPAWLLALGLAVGVVAALAGAILPSRRASRVDPARALAGQGS